jgi:hypothetical protein
MPIVLTTELGDGFLCLESDVRTRVHVLLVQPYSTLHRTPSSNKCHRNTTILTGTYFFFTLPGQYSFQMTESSVTHVCTDCQNICSGRFGGNLRTTVLRRSVPLAFDCPWRFSLGLDRDCFFAGSIVTLDMGGKCRRTVLVRVVSGNHAHR